MKPTTAKKLLLAGAALLIPAAATGQNSNLIVPGYAWIGSGHSGDYFDGVLAVGKNNLLAIGTPADTGSAAIGTGIYTVTTNSLTVGQYNSTPAGSPTRFMVGNGTGSSAGTRSTIMDARQDGTVTLKKVPAKGGISMGAFTAPALSTPPPA